ncbi:MAG: thioredoxin fold domain-containing protein [Gammaproteobacteria bacterium]|nr:thioredoxin fold domain-containing protein [Gammaproteobacteria bacterium]
MFFNYTKTLIICLMLFACSGTNANQLQFDDLPLKETLELPPWFNLSFLDLQDSLDEAIAAGKRGLIVYFGRKDCAYCKALLETNWGEKDIIDYTRKNFHVIAIDVIGQRTVTDFDKRTYTEKEFATRLKMNFTPSLLFFDTQGRLALRLSGYRPIYQFRAILEYVADTHYRNIKLKDYLARAEPALSFGQDEMNENDVFLAPPHNLDRSQIQADKPLVVFFEHPKCHACDVLHGGPLSNPEINAQLYNMDAIQLDTTADTPVITPDGIKTTSHQWANKLGLTFAPSMLFFDRYGKEIIRIESVIQFHRLNNVLLYVLGEGYKQYPTFQLWRENMYKQIK